MSRNFISRTICILFIAAYNFLVPENLNAQQKLSDFILYAGGSGTGEGITLMGSSITINNGIVGARKLVQTTGNTTINADIYSGDRIILTNSNVVTGKISALNSSGSANAISIGSSATLGDNIADSILAKGGISIGGGSVAGIVRLPAGQTYSGPTPASGPSAVVYSEPYIPPTPDLFPVTNLSGTGGSDIVTTNQTYEPGTYGTINYSGNKRLILKAPLNSSGNYVYHFKAFKWTGNSNKLEFDFNGGTGKFFVYVEGNADFGKLNASTIGGNGGQIYLETYGDGVGTTVPGNSFIIANGSSGGGSKWFGTVYASRAGINIGSGTGSSTLTGALYSATNVSIQSGVEVYYAPFDPCSKPIVNAGIDRPLNFIDADSLRGSSTTTNPYLTWTVLPGSGGSLDLANKNNDTVEIYSAGIYILTDSTGPSCFVSDTVEIFSKVRDVIGSELLSIYINKPAFSPFFVIADGKVKIDVIAFEGKRDEVRDTLVNYGFTNFYPNGDNPYMLTGDFPIANILLLNNFGSIINYCRTYYQPFTFKNNFFNTSDSARTGLVISQGDTTLRTHLVRPGYKLNGAGIKIGILSDSYGKKVGNTVAIPPYNPVPGPAQTFTTQDVRGDIISGDLPADTILQRPGQSDTLIRNPQGFAQNVKVIQDFPVALSDEGRAMAEIVHDVAPGAGIVFRTAFYTANDFAQGIIDLKNAGCTIIVDDVTYPTEPFLKDGVVARTVDSLAINHNITYLSAAGNFADQSYEKNYTPVDASDIGFAGKTAHDFGSGDRFQKIKLRPGNYTFVFQWLDNIYSIGQGGTLYDLDIFLSKKTDGTELIGFNRNNINGDPIEFIPITILGDNATDTVAKEYNLLVINNSTSGNPARIKYIVFKRDGRADIQWQEYHEGVSTIIGQSNAVNALAIGAARFNHTVDRYSLEPHPLMPDPLNDIPASSITKPQLESFSSVGGTHVNGAPRQKPDLVSADGVNTMVRLGQDYPNNALDGYSNFFGTSAAAPHAAAAAALIMEGRKKFLPGQPSTSPAEIKSLFQSTAFDMLTPGFDYSSGAGLIDADSAMRTFASPTPFEIELIVPTNTVPGQTQFTLIITGQNFSANSYVVLGDTTGMSNGTADTTQIWPSSITKDEITVIINSFTGNPPVMVYSPPKTEFGDGGFSNILYFFTGKIVVQAVNITKDYGAPMPLLDTIITINDSLIQETNYTLADIGLSGLTVTTSATAGSPVGPYSINVNGNLDPNDPADTAFLNKYTYQFINGTVLVAPLTVTVVPDDDTVVYGQPINNITYKYYNSSGNLITNPVLLNELDSSQHVYMADNVLAVINGYPGSPALNDADFEDMSGLITFNAIRNSRKYQFTNGSLIPSEPADSNKLSGQYYIDVSAQSFIDYKTNAATGILNQAYPGITSKAIVSAASLLNGTAQTGLNTTNLVKLVNGELVKVVNAAAGGTLVPVVNGQLMQVVNGLIIENDTTVTINGELVKVVNGELVKVVNGELVKVVNGELVHVVNGELVKVVNGELVKVVNGELVKLVNAAGGTLVQMVNGVLMQVVNGVGLVPVVNGELVKVVNGELVKVVNNEPVANYTLVKLVNGGLVQVVNGVGLVQMVNGIEIPLANGLVQVVNGELMQVVNGELVKIVNGGILVPVVNGLVPVVNSYTVANGNNEKAVVILDLYDTARNTTLGAIFSANIITGLDVGVQSLISGMVKNNNFKFRYAPGHITIRKDTITVAAVSVSRVYGEPNPELTVTYNGFEFGQNKQTSGITGEPVISTTATLTSPVGTYPITVTVGTLASANYAFKFVNGTLTVNVNECLLTHSPFKNFGNTTQSPTSLWFNLVTKVSGQLTDHDDSLVFKGATITLNSILSTPLIRDSVLPDGIIIADNSVSAPVTSFDFVKRRWITKIPPGFASTSDIFVTGAIINSSTGFVKHTGNTSSTVKGIFYSNRNFSDQWAYAIAAYQLPQVPVPPVYATYGMIGSPGDIVPINGTYRACTPIPLIPYVVQGGSGGGGNNYAGSNSSFENFTACLVTAPAPITQRQVNTAEQSQAVPGLLAAGISIYPNPAADHITLMIVPAQHGNSRTELLSMNGAKLFEATNGNLEAGLKYIKEINTGHLPNGIYLIRVWSGNTVTNKKIIISR